MSTGRVLVSSGTEFEATVGYSRAVRIGPVRRRRIEVHSSRRAQR